MTLGIFPLIPNIQTRRKLYIHIAKIREHPKLSAQSCFTKTIKGMDIDGNYFFMGHANHCPVFF